VLERIYAERGAYNIDFLRDMSIDEARAWLMSFDGIGPKTAAIVLCFAFGRPAFPVDTHIYRVGQRLGMIPAHFNVERAHPLMESMVPPDQHYAFHIYLIRHGRDTCTARKPYCERCPLRTACDYYATEVLGGSVG
jgi:endonuclease-3